MVRDGCIFACTDKSEKECLEKKLFGAGKIHEDKVLDVKKGTILFLYNLTSGVLSGPFEAVTNGQKNIDSKIWRGFYPYQVKIKQHSESIQKINQFNEIEDMLELDWKNNLLDSKLTKFIIKLLEQPKAVVVKEYVEKNKLVAPPPPAEIRNHY